MRFRVILLVLMAACESGCEDAPPDSVSPPPTTQKPTLAIPKIAVRTASPTAPVRIPDSPRFVDRHSQLGVEFIYDNGADPRALMVQSTGGGGAWLDYDRDGAIDLIVAQGGNPTADHPHPMGDRLYRNHGGERFQDVSPSALPPDSGYSQGVAVGDYDDDGLDDLLISQVATDTLLHNLGDGTFEEVPVPFSSGHDRWGTSAAWYDIDTDGDLDLFVCNYLSYDVFHPVPCRDPNGKPFICHPEELDPDRSECYENLGDGTFRPVAEAWGLTGQGKALGIVIAQLNDDHWPDIFVANDTMSNFLYLGTGPRQFQEQAVTQGCAYNSIGQYQANMGVACGDYDRNGYLDLYITTFTDDSNTLFSNLGANGFRDVTRLEGLHAPTIDTLGFGTVMTDLNADGAMDLFITNGHIDDWRDRGESWKMPAEMLSFDGRLWHKHSAKEAGDFLNQEYLGRAVSMADYDRDGDTDLLVVHQGDPASILTNESHRGRWLQVELTGTSSNRHAIGAKVTVTGEGLSLTQQLVGGSSYLTTHEPLLHFGLGDYQGPLQLRVDWPSLEASPYVGSVESNQRVRIVEGRGTL
ncbi:MAG: CRTAC1 family protein [Planctomycetota bacterium]|nr:MAG: CRTAC1 family protein [Planctomycetota bacterium]